MGTYKVIQDIEAEDTIIGWMTPRQAIYAAIVLVSGFICFLFASKGAWFLALPLLPHMILFTVLAGPFVHDQPSEVWLLAKIKFFLKPRRRIWDQAGIKELVTITVPKKIERTLTDGLSQNEVKSRLEALANTIDSRGWAIKNISTNMFAQPNYAVAASSDRLIDQGYLPQQVPDDDLSDVQDVLDTSANPVAQQMQQMVTRSAAAHRQQLMAQMQRPQATPSQSTQNQWFVDPVATQNVLTSQQVSQTDEALYRKIKQQRESSKMATGNLATITPLPEQPKVNLALQPANVDPAVVQQFVQNNDLNISTIARQVNKHDDDNEVVVSLR